MSFKHIHLYTHQHETHQKSNLTHTKSSVFSPTEFSSQPLYRMHDITTVCCYSEKMLIWSTYSLSMRKLSQIHCALSSALCWSDTVKQQQNQLKWQVSLSLWQLRISGEAQNSLSMSMPRVFSMTSLWFSVYLTVRVSGTSFLGPSTLAQSSGAMGEHSVAAK